MSDIPRHTIKLDCSTCGATGITVWADHVSACPGFGEIQVTRERGRGVIVETAPPRALIGLLIIRDLAWPANIVNDSAPDLVNIADQVLYRVVGYDAGHASLIVELVEDWRPGAGGSTGDGICTATIKAYGGRTTRCAQAAGHYDGDKQPEPLVDDDPRGWHRSAPGRDGDSMTWSDRASGATPHQTAGEQP